MSDWENFDYDEFACSHCGQNQTQHRLIDFLQDLRSQLGFAFRITSGYRCPDHPLEQKKSRPGAHALGLAADIAVSHANAFQLVKAAMADPRLKGLGVSQKGSGVRFIHLDMAPPADQRPRPHIWSY